MVIVLEVIVLLPVAALAASDAVMVPLVCTRVEEAVTTPEELTDRPPPLGLQVTNLVMFWLDAVAVNWDAFCPPRELLMVVGDAEIII